MANPNWTKGVSGNPKGRKKKTAAVDELRKAIKAAEKKHDQTLMEHFVHRAYEDSTVLIAVMRKLIPDKRVQDLNLGGQQDNPVNVVMYDGYRRDNPK